MTSHQDVAGVVAELRAVADRVGASWAFEPLRQAADLLEAQAKALSEAEAERERMWCTACGTVTRDKVCDCNRYQAGHEMRREPSFVNYADECNKDAREQFSRANAAEARLAEATRVIEPFITAGDISHKNNCYFEEFLTDGAVEAARAFTNAAKEKT